QQPQYAMKNVNERRANAVVGQTQVLVIAAFGHVAQTHLLVLSALRYQRACPSGKATGSFEFHAERIGEDDRLARVEFDGAILEAPRKVELGRWICVANACPPEHCFEDRTFDLVNEAVSWHLLAVLELDAFVLRKRAEPGAHGSDHQVSPRHALLPESL